MASSLCSTATLSRILFSPLDGVAESCEAFRHCPSLPDQSWLELGVMRLLHDLPSGRALLQQLGPLVSECPARSLFFVTMCSSRRLKLCEQAAARIADAVGGDALADYPTLANFDLYAADGHWHSAAIHDQPIDGSRRAVGHFYAMDLRTGAVRPLTAAQGKKEHDMHALKRQQLQRLRWDAPKGRKVLYVYDAAGIDFAQWHRWKHTGGVYFVSVTKENMRLEVIAQNPFDVAEAINAGVIADELVATSQHVAVRRVRFRDHATGRDFEFLTSELTLPPGLIAFLYRRRWDLEKSFDEFKNKLGQTRAWGSSANAKAMQAQLLCLAYNLIKLFEAYLVQHHDLSNKAELDRRQQRRQRHQANATAAGASLPAAVLAWKRLTQTSLKLYRWLRAFFFSQLPLEALLPALRASYASL